MGQNTDFDTLASSRKRFWSFSPEINTGHLLTILALVLSVFAGWSDIRTTQALQQRDIDQIRASSKDDQVRIKESLADMKGDLRELQGSVNQLTRAINQTQTTRN